MLQLVLTIGLMLFLYVLISYLSEQIVYFKWYRRMKGGTWHKYRFTGQLPGLYGTTWHQGNAWPEHRYYTLIKTETYDR